ncbi:MAG TPA: hypothetical protein V6D33_00675 [Cyanophyceae cyanobacterium]
MFKKTPAITDKQQSLEQSVFLAKLRNAIWLLGVSSWLFGITDRSIASFSDGYLSAWDIIQLSTASFFFVSWLFLKPSSIENQAE